MFVNTLKSHFINIKGSRTQNRIIVIESDDWGSIRIPSKTALDFLRNAGFLVDECNYMLNDSLESNDDMESMFSLIESKKKKPIITANFLTSNPNFEKILADNFEKYHNESILDTLNKYPNHDKVKDYWKSGLNKGYFIPQLHGREHLNVNRWMNDLKQGNTETKIAFEQKVSGVSANVVKEKRRSYQAAFDFIDNDGSESKSDIFSEAFLQFKNIFGFSPVTFIAPNYTWDDKIEKKSSELGIKLLQGANVQRLPRGPEHKLNVKRHWFGQKNSYEQSYSIRNATFEPFSDPSKDWVSSCLKEIETAFFWKKPAIIQMHRVNFIGSINPNNRSNNLEQFSRLLDLIDKKWPDVEFMSTADLTKII
jgi:hypothetical protein